jgi:hypothetical protein
MGPRSRTGCRRVARVSLPQMGVVACLVVGRHGERGLVHAGGLAALGQDRVGYGIAGRVCAAMQRVEDATSRSDIHSLPDTCVGVQARRSTVSWRELVTDGA